MITVEYGRVNVSLGDRNSVWQALGMLDYLHRRTRLYVG